MLLCCNLGGGLVKSKLLFFVLAVIGGCGWIMREQGSCGMGFLKPLLKNDFLRLNGFLVSLVFIATFDCVGSTSDCTK